MTRVTESNTKEPESVGKNVTTSETFPLDFHHLDPSIKEFNLTRNSIGWEKLKPELDKCVLLCSNCHRMIHAGVILLPDDPASDGTCLTSRH